MRVASLESVYYHLLSKGTMTSKIMDCCLLPTFSVWFDHFLSLESESKNAVTSTITLQMFGFSAGSCEPPKFKRFTFFSKNDTCSIRRCVAKAFMNRFCCCRYIQIISVQPKNELTCTTHSFLYYLCIFINHAVLLLCVVVLHEFKRL